MKKSAFKFTNYKEPNLSPFEKLFNIFKELIIHTSGDFDEAIDWLRELDKEYQLTDENYTICLLYTSPSPRDATLSRMPSSA